MTPKLTPIDFATLTNKTGLDLTATYMAMVHGELYIGTFSMQWFGYIFRPTFGANNLQFDVPPNNCSRWQLLWKIENAKEMADSLEVEYAIRQRKYCIEHRMESNGQTIDNSAPIEAFYYRPKVSAMPAVTDDCDGDPVLRDYNEDDT